MPFHFIHLISLAFTQTIPHSKLKARLKELAQSCFIKHNDQNRYTCLVWERWNLFYEKQNSLKLILWKCSSLKKSFLICYAWYKCFSTSSRLFHEYQLCSSSHRPVTLFVRKRFHTVTSKEKKRASLVPYFNTPLYKWHPSLFNFKCGDYLDFIKLIWNKE